MPKHDESTRERGLLALAVNNGEARRAERELAKMGVVLSEVTLREWRRKYPQRYEAIRTAEAPRLRAKVVDEHLSQIGELLAVERQMTARLSGEVDEIPARDLPGGVRNVITGIGIHTDKVIALREQPTVRVSLDLPGTLKELKEMGVEVIDAVPVEDAKAIGSGDG